MSVIDCTLSKGLAPPGGRKLRYIGGLKNQFWMTMEAIAYNLVRMANLQARPA